jgi:hypothetical protein
MFSQAIDFFFDGLRRSIAIRRRFRQPPRRHDGAFMPSRAYFQLAVNISQILIYDAVAAPLLMMSLHAAIFAFHAEAEPLFAAITPRCRHAAADCADAAELSPA